MKYRLMIIMSSGELLFDGNGLTAYMVIEILKIFEKYPIPFDKNLIIKCFNAEDSNE